MAAESEVKTTSPDDDGPKSVLLARQLQVSRYLDPWGAPQITWVHSHQIVRGFKVILNLYDILPPRLNSFLTGCGLGGAFHSGIEVAGTEYAFGGASGEDQGIMALARPLFVLRREAEEVVKAGQHDSGSAAAALEWMPVLRSRVVVGWWLGSLAELDTQVLRPLWLQGKWVGPAYRLLSRNCNHFSRALCGALLAHSSFKAAPGKADPLRMVPRKVTRLSSLAAALRCCTSRMDSALLEQQRLAAAAAAAAEEEGGSRTENAVGAVTGASAHTQAEPGLERRSAAVNAAAAAAEARAAAAAARASPTRLGGARAGGEGGRRTPPFATPAKQTTSADAARRASRDHPTAPQRVASGSGLLTAASAGVSPGEGPAEAPGFVPEVCSTAPSVTTATASASASTSDGPALPMPLAAHLGLLKASAGRVAAAAAAAAPGPGPHGPAARSRSGRRVFPDPGSTAPGGDVGAGTGAGDGDAAEDETADAAVAAVMSSRRALAVEEGAGGAWLPDPAAGLGGDVAVRAESGSAQRLSVGLLKQHNGQRPASGSVAVGLAAGAGGGSAAASSASRPPPGPQQPPLPPGRAPLPPLRQATNSPVNANASAQGASVRLPSPQPPDGEPPRPWSVLSGGYVDLTFDRSAQATPEPPPGVPAPDPKAAQLPPPGAVAAGLICGSHGAAGGATASASAGGLAAARPATVSGSGAEAGAGGAAGAARARAPSPLPRGSGTGTATAKAPAVVDAAAVGAGGVAEAAPPSSPPSRYEIIAAVDASSSSRCASRHNE
ncbi:hypothetical protein HXX76_005323 [Chlamydomonas incerta]|uniref:PPPDE domain-containing protein n=1 Tax=Chlamydomonas incerta TaxID=51695 RepID=A0A835T830_CHLIN|nr:hypothetical protein HXX76_005323 [Chlamydomonas incerta]|eukprot:KAG2438782.1 hypothetical protein HXX76_005323 [Chlamydomonas incerta]